MDKRYVDLDEILLALPKEAGKIIRDWPTADVREIKRGKWIHNGEIMYCNRCQYIVMSTRNFCPNCGADMRETNNKKDDVQEYLNRWGVAP